MGKVSIVYTARIHGVEKRTLSCSILLIRGITRNNIFKIGRKQNKTKKKKNDERDIVEKESTLKRMIIKLKTKHNHHISPKRKVNYI